MTQHFTVELPLYIQGIILVYYVQKNVFNTNYNSDTYSYMVTNSFPTL